MFDRKYCITANINVPIITEVYIVFLSNLEWKRSKYSTC